jgi:hypothetical protein
MPNHNSVANVIFLMIEEGAREKEIAEYLEVVYKQVIPIESDHWKGAVDKQSGAFTQAEIDDTGWH